jgi:hypothetical protein
MGTATITPVASSTASATAPTTTVAVDAPADPAPTTVETLSEDRLEERLRHLVEEGTARRVIVRHDGEVIADFPLAAGVIGTLLAARVAGVAVLVGLLADCTIEVERIAPTPDEPAVPAAPTTPVDIAVAAAPA